MVDQHFLAGRDVEFLFHQMFDDMPRQVGRAGEWRQGGYAPSLVGVGVAFGRADGEGRQFVEEEIQPVVIAEDDGDIRLLLGEPVMRGSEPVEEGLPVGFFLFPPGDRAADGGHV